MPHIGDHKTCRSRFVPHGHEWTSPQWDVTHFLCIAEKCHLAKAAVAEFYTCWIHKSDRQMWLQQESRLVLPLPPQSKPPANTQCATTAVWRCFPLLMIPSKSTCNSLSPLFLLPSLPDFETALKKKHAQGSLGVRLSTGTSFRFLAQPCEGITRVPQSICRMPVRNHLSSLQLDQKRKQGF